MFLLWSSDTSPVLSHSPSSRWPICIVPASRYVYENGVNITIQALTHAITNSFNTLSNFGIPVRDLASLGGGLVPLMSIGAKGFPFKQFQADASASHPVGKHYVCARVCVCVCGCVGVCVCARVCRDEVGRLRLYVLGYRGDWKALVALFNMKRNYSVNEVWCLKRTTFFF